MYILRKCMAFRQRKERRKRRETSYALYLGATLLREKTAIFWSFGNDLQEWSTMLLRDQDLIFCALLKRMDASLCPRDAREGGRVRVPVEEGSKK